MSIEEEQETPLKNIDRYSEIPKEILCKGRILDIGSGDGYSQCMSKHGDLFKSLSESGKYRGLDIAGFSQTYLNIEKGDIMGFPIEETFDVVLAMHVIEHIPFHLWGKLFQKIKTLVSEGGWVVVGVPYREPSFTYDNFCGSDLERHRVFDIDEYLLGRFLPDVKVYLSNRSYFNVPKDKPLKRSVWWLRCLITGKMRRLPFSLGRKAIVALWKKKTEGDPIRTFQQGEG